MCEKYQKPVEDKVSTGSALSLSEFYPSFQERYLTESPTPKDNLKKANKLATDIGNSWLLSPTRDLEERCKKSLAKMGTMSSPDQEPQSPMSGKTRPMSKEPDLNWAKELFEDKKQEIGTKSGTQPSTETLWTSQPTSEYVVLLRSAVSVLDTLKGLQWNVPYLSFGETLVLEKVVLLGKKLVWKLTLKIPEQSGGMVTSARNTLLLMNFVVVSTSPTSSDGLTGIRFWWKRKEDLFPYELPLFG